MAANVPACAHLASWLQSKTALLRYAIYFAVFVPAWFIVVVAVPGSEMAFDALRERGELVESAEWLHRIAGAHFVVTAIACLGLFSWLVLGDILLERRASSRMHPALLRPWSYVVVCAGIALTGLMGIMLQVTIQRAATYL